MLETDLFWTFITILSTVIEWIVLRFLLEEISKLKKSKIQLNMSLLIASIIVLILTNKEFNINSEKNTVIKSLIDEILT